MSKQALSRGHDARASGMTRRQALGRGTVLGAGLLGVDRVARLLSSSEVAQAAVPPRYSKALPALPELTGQNITLVAAQTPVQVLTGPATQMWTFNGSFPGPLIRRPSGVPSYVTVQNRLPAGFGTMTIHHHGSHVKPDYDGQPERNVIQPGGELRYEYLSWEDGEPERAAMQWYHDHTLLKTGRNVWMGLAGVSILEDDYETALGLPSGDREIVLVIADRAFDAGNQLINPFTAPTRETLPPTQTTGQGYPPFDEVVGDHHLVNGVIAPFKSVKPATYRLRILNASNFQPYNLQLGSIPFVQIGTESGLLPQSVSRDTVLIGPAERVDLLVDFSGSRGQKITLDSVTRTDAGNRPVQGAALAKLMRFDVESSASVPTFVAPAQPRPLPDWAAGVKMPPTRVWAIGLGNDSGGRVAWTINGQAFDHRRVDARPELGATETWLFANVTPSAASHMIHLHDVDWVMLSRNGVAPPPWEQGLKDVFRIDPGEVIVVGTKFTDHIGNYMFHCHLLEHEDHGMMTNWEVMPRGKGDQPYVSELTHPATFNGQKVNVPLDQVRGAAQQQCMAEILRQISARPGVAAKVPAAIPKIAPPKNGEGTAAALLCRLNVPGFS